MNQIQTSLDWPAVEKCLIEQAKIAPAAEHDLCKMIRNIGTLVGELSKEEIACRRKTRQTLQHRELVTQINQQIVFCEQMVLIAALC